MIELINLTKIYRGLRAVDNVTLKVTGGCLFGFLGPNGAGKTTTVKMMAGVLKPTSGRILINGLDLAEEPAAVKRCVAFIPDRPYVYDKLTALEFLDLVAALYGIEKGPPLVNRMSGLLEIFDLVHWQDELLESYSHGMKQRLVMCAALLQDPKVLVVDEPMVGLDPGAANMVKEIFKDQARKGTTVFMSTHSLDVAEEVCEEIAIIQAGRIIARGDPDALRRQTGISGTLEDVFLRLTEGKKLAHERPLSSH